MKKRAQEPFGADAGLPRQIDAGKDRTFRAQAAMINACKEVLWVPVKRI
ncbi:hypothetical protein [Acetatifactor aquisgranensis]|nr:hypothetical protein [Acetatifactor aquisgranensis]